MGDPVASTHVVSQLHPVDVGLTLKTSDAAQRTVELLGEHGDWISSQVLPPRAVADGVRFETRLQLPTGVYAYKFRVDGEWTLDPDSATTRSRDGHRNNVLVVGGADEPLIFAPAAPFASVEDGGGLTVTTLLRRSAAPGWSVIWQEAGSPSRRAPLVPRGQEDEHLVMSARLPVSTRAVHLWFVGPQGQPIFGPNGRPLQWSGRPDEHHGVPDWWRDGIVYTIFVDRFRPATDRPQWTRDPGRDRPAGGHLEGIRRSLDELCELGVSVLYLTPIQVARSCHRYDLVDPLRVDPALGGEDAARRLLADAHRRGLKILLDFSFSHAGRGFAPYEEVLVKGRASRYADWFRWTADQPARLRHYGRRDDAPLLNLDHPPVRELVGRAVDAWAKLGVDGLRLDAAAEVPMDVAREIRARLRRHNPAAVVLGEIVPSHAWRWRSSAAVDAATDFGFHTLALDFLVRRQVDARQVRHRLQALAFERGGPTWGSVRFVSTHDHARFSTQAHLAGRPGAVPLGLVWLLTLPEVPALLYGEELGLHAHVDTLEPENAWPDRAPMPWGPREGNPIRDLVRRLIQVRRASRALRRGELEVAHAEGDLLVYRRHAGDEVVDVVIHRGDEPAEIDLADDELGAGEVLVTVGEVSWVGCGGIVGPHAAVVLRRLPSPRDRRRRLNTVASNAEIRDREFARAATTVRARPTRLDFALTEICNLRCAHCITHAPQRTRDGEARTLQPWLLERLRPEFAFASYYGFVHGGESLTAPIFWDVLEAIGVARQGQATTVHLLSNGLLLDTKTATRLVDQGVNSVSVSLDGASAEVNDAIRSGGRFDRVVRNLDAMSTMRRDTHADLRLGVSFVLMQHNRHQLLDMVDLCARLGLDWIKFEEAVPVNAFSRRSLVSCTSEPVRDLVARALARARNKGVVAVDHTVDRDVWRCRLPHEPEVARFLAADEFANRSEINPCRAPWERACIEPNGDVRIGDVLGSVLGNLAEAELAALWNGRMAQSERTRACQRRVCGGGSVSCVP